MPLQATSGAASYDAFGGGVPAVPNYIEDFFRTHLYNGDTGGYIFASSGVSIVSGGMMWVKSRGSATNHYIFSPSLTSANHYLNTNTTAAQSNSGVTNNNFESVDNGGGMRFGDAFSGISSSATGPYTSWTFRKQPKFFDVVTYTGNGTAGRTVAHNLGSVPGCLIVKCTSTTGGWATLHKDAQLLYLQSTNAQTTAATTANRFGDGTNVIRPTSTEFTVGTSSDTNTNGATYVAYLFAHDAGGFGLTGTDNVISCGSYTGTGSVPNDITLGFEPQWLLVKNTTSSGQEWGMFDNMRGLVTGTDGDAQLFANASSAENISAYFRATATGFACEDASTRYNNSGNTYIYIAIRRGPMKVPTSGTSVFYPNAYSGTGTDTTITSTGFPPDLFFSKARSFSSAFLNVMVDRLRGASQFLVPSNIIGETVGTNVVLSLNMNGVTLGSSSNANSGTVTYAQWNFRRAPSFFDEVCYTGTGSTLTVDHNLQATPELIIIKRRNGNSSTGWVVYESNLGFNKYMILNQVGPDTLQYLTATSSTTFTLNSGGYTDTNSSGNTYVAYLFATCAGVSKVFSYTGNGSSQTINCGFTGGARFVLIKRTDVSSGNWFVWDTARGIVSGNDPYLSLNTTAVEVTSDDSIDTNSTGFVVNQVSATNVNVSSATYIGLAIA